MSINMLFRNGSVTTSTEELASFSKAIKGLKRYKNFIYGPRARILDSHGIFKKFEIVQIYKDV